MIALSSIVTLLFILLSLFLVDSVALDSTTPFFIPPKGQSTLTHYDLPFDYVASCGCVGLSTRYPTAAINSFAYGSSLSYGPSCGHCYRLRLVSTPYSPPPPQGNGIVFQPDDTTAPTIVVKITDACPVGGDWCSQTAENPRNVLNSTIHFDLAWPSIAISHSFYPTDDGRDYGAWWADYKLVDCKEWAGYQDKEAWGSDWSQQSSACCPLRPDVLQQDVSSMGSSDNQAQENETISCPSYTDQLSLHLTYDEMASQVPNTSNILSKKDQGETNGAWSFFQSAFFWFPSSSPTINPERQQITLEDWQSIGVPPLLRR